MKSDRLLAIAMILLYRRTGTVGELARQFGVSDRTIYRDLAALDCAGFPLVSSPGRGGGIGLMPGYRLESRLFAPGSLAVFASTLETLGDLLDDSELDQDARLAAHTSPAGNSGIIRLELASPGFRELAPLMRDLGRALRQNQVVAIEYVGTGGGQSSRQIEPLRLILWSGDWYLQAWCRLRTDYRMFRLRRIIKHSLVGQTFDRAARLENLPEPEAEPIPVGDPIRLRLPADRQDLILKFTSKVPAETGRDYAEIEIDWPRNQWLVQYLCGLAPEVQVLQPLDLRQEVSRRLTMAAEIYRRPQNPDI